MEKKNKKPLVFIALLLIVGVAIGATIAFYTSSDTFNNEFDTGTYKIETQEAFVSPDNWTPGTTTPKTVIATNKGTTPAAVRIKLTPSWEDANGDPLPLKDGNDNDAAIINFASNLNSKWIYDNGYYYYKKALNENDSTTTLIDSVTFNPDLDINNTKDCETVNGVTTCTTEFIDYAGGKYTLQIEVETAQFDKYKEIWSTDVNIKATRVITGTLKKQTNSDGVMANPFGGNSGRKQDYESITIVDSNEVPANAFMSWDASEEQNGSIMAWYLDTNNNYKLELFIGQDGGVIANPDSSYAFASYINVSTFNLEKLDTSYVTDMNHMFASSSENVDDFRLIGIDKWDTSNVEDMSFMFYYLNYLDYQNPPTTSFIIDDIGNWDVSNVTNMSFMFCYAGRYASPWSIGDLSNWDVSNVTDMSHMFTSVGGRSESISIGDLSDWDTRNVETMEEMFSGTGATTTINIGSLKIYATNVKKAFYYSRRMQATLNIYSNPTTYTSLFAFASTYTGSLITVNYSNSTTNIDALIATKGSNSSVVNGSQLD